MKVQIVVTDDRGKMFEGEAVLTPRRGVKSSSRSRPVASAAKSKPAIAAADLDFTQSARAFVLAHGRNMTGAQKFTLLIAWITKGKTEQSVDFKRVQSDWNRMTEPMGGKFNPAYTTRACDRSWTESPKKGTYRLRPSWTEIFSG